jgi:hypothetical protein
MVRFEQHGKLAAPRDCPTTWWEVGTRMRSFKPQADSPEIVLERHISVKAAAEASGSILLYLRRFWRKGHLDGVKIASLETYLRNGLMARDWHHGPGRIVDDAGEAVKA